jgi:prepilin-type N-terminal cleavage/methylation domain-containing protein
VAALKNDPIAATLNLSTTMKRHSLTPAARGFTLIELLVTISIVALLVTGAFSAFGFVMEKARKTDARNACMTIINGIEQFQNEYQRLPEPTSYNKGQDTDSSTEPSENLINILMARDDQQNPRKHNTLGDIKPATMKNGAPAGGLNEEGESSGLYDPWGNVYQVRLDHDYDEKVENPNDKQTSEGGTTTLRKQCIAWTEGNPKSVKDGQSVWDEAAVSSWSDK